MGVSATSSDTRDTVTTLVKSIRKLGTLNEDMGEIDNGAIYIRGNQIEWVGTMDALPETCRTADRVIDLSSHVVIPGMVNTHHHMFQSLTKCLAQDKTLFHWLKALYPGWEHLTGDDYYHACRVAMAELILSGCTTSVDHHYLFPNDVSMERGIEAAKELGLRFHAARGAMSRGQSKGGLPPDHLVEEEETALARTQALIEKFHDNSRFAMVRVVVAPTSQKTVTDDYFRKAAALARRYPGVRLHTHLAENQDDVDYIERMSGYRFGEYIRSIGWDEEDCWFAHCCKLDEAEMDLFREKGIGVAHCPSSNLRLASGVCPVRKMVDKGVNVGLGVDGSASNDSSHMLAEARLACLLQRSSADPKGMSAREALWCATRGGAKNLGRDDIGQIAPGFAADIVAWRADSLGFCGAQTDLLAALIWCAPSLGFVDLSMINGRVVVEGGRLLTGDVSEIVSKANSASARLCSYYTPEAVGR
eukprot:jgi/Botrbrau1/10079/Bobra.0355s0032.1